MGSCGLHTTHNAFKTPFEQKLLSTTWSVKKLLTAICYLFHNTLSRKGDYAEANSKLDKIDFPSQFCSIRWVENDAVAH